VIASESRLKPLSLQLSLAMLRNSAAIPSLASLVETASISAMQIMASTMKWLLTLKPPPTKVIPAGRQSGASDPIPRWGLEAPGLPGTDRPDDPALSYEMRKRGGIVDWARGTVDKHDRPSMVTNNNQTGAASGASHHGARKVAGRHSQGPKMESGHHPKALPADRHIGVVSKKDASVLLPAQI